MFGHQVFVCLFVFKIFFFLSFGFFVFILPAFLSAAIFPEASAVAMVTVPGPIVPGGTGLAA